MVYVLHRIYIAFTACMFTKVIKMTLLFVVICGALHVQSSCFISLICHPLLCSDNFIFRFV